MTTTTGNPSTPPPSGPKSSSTTSNRDTRGRYKFDEAALCTCGHPFADHRDVGSDGARPRCDSPTNQSCRCDHFTPQIGGGDYVGLLAHSSTERPRPRRLPFSDLPPDVSGCRTFTASLRDDREMLGARVTEFLKNLRAVAGTVRDYDVVQSSDHAFHCLSIIVWYEAPVGVRL